VTPDKIKIPGYFSGNLNFIRIRAKQIGETGYKINQHGQQVKKILFFHMGIVCQNTPDIPKKHGAYEVKQKVKMSKKNSDQKYRF
jgi:hypothetical protein